MHEILLSHYQALLPRHPGRTLCLGTAGSYGTETIRIIPGAGWKELTVTATFHPADGSAIRVPVPSDGILSVPPEAAVLGDRSADTSPVIVFSGTADGVQRISADLEYTVLSHASIEGDDSLPPTESEWALLTAAYGTKVDKQQSIADAGKVLGIGADGKVIPMVYTANTGSSGGSSAPADWLVNDPAAPGYIQNRTHWAEDPVHVTVLPEQTVTIGEDGTGFLPYEAPLIVGDEYTLTIDGVSYTETAFDMDGLVALGNMGFAGLEDTGEPYLAAYVEAENLMLFLMGTPGDHTLSIIGEHIEYHTIDRQYLPYLIGREGTGRNAELFNTEQNRAGGDFAHAEGMYTIANGEAAHTEGAQSDASGQYAHAEGCGTIASGTSAHAEGYECTAFGMCSHAEGQGTYAGSTFQHVQGRWNLIDMSGQYAHVIGAGLDGSNRRNIHTVKWNGDAWYAGTVEGTALILKSPNGTRYKVTVSDTGALETIAV